MDLSLFALFLASCVGAGATGALFPPGEWYRQLSKPRWTPPDWVFPVAWFTLYICMSAAAARIAVLDGNAHAMAFWSVQIVLNALWSPVFFGLKRISGGMVAVAALWLAVAATLVSFAWLDPLAGWLFAPYLLWVTIAAALNFAVLRLNPEAAAA